MQIDTDGSQTVSDEGDEHDEHLDGARPIGEIGTMVFKRVQLPFQVFVALRHRLTQRPPVIKKWDVILLEREKDNVCVPRHSADHAHSVLSPIRIVHQSIDY